MTSLLSRPANQREHAGKIRMNGSRHQGQNRARSRITLAMILICGVYGVIAARLVYFGMVEPSDSVRLALADPTITARRPDLVDRNGRTLGTDINTASLYAEPRRIVDVDEAVELLSTVLPDLNSERIYQRLSGNAGFVWLRREITPAQQSRILELGVPGIGFKRETRRFYPNGPVASHLVGHVNIDNVGIAGAEKVIDERGLKDLRAAGFGDLEQSEPVNLSLDIRVQSIVHDELQMAMERYRAIAAGCGSA